MNRYAQLFAVSIEHGYYLNFGAVPHPALTEDRRDSLKNQFAVKRLFNITPTADTVKNLAGQRMLFKSTAEGFLVGVEVPETGSANFQPLVQLANDLRLRFAITLNDKHFCNYTNLPTRSGGLYHFSNRTGNAAPGNFLSRPVPDYDSEKAYEAGELYLHPSAPGEGVFRAVRDTGPAASPVAADWERIPPDTYDPSITYTTGAIVLSDDRIYLARVDGPGTDLTDTAEWQLLSNLPRQYVTGDDFLPLHSVQLKVDVGTAGVALAFVAVYPLGESEAVWQHQFIAENGNLDELVLPLQHLRPGAYHLEIADSLHNVLSDLNYDFYFDGKALSQNWFAVIDIGVGSGSFALLDSSGNLANPGYTLNFLNRATRWRYIFPAAQPIGTGAQVVQEDSTGQVLVTSVPLPLTRFGTGIPLQTDSAATPSVSEEVLLPEPRVNRIRYQAEQWFSEIHLSNLPL